jgi:hypothetical protein
MNIQAGNKLIMFFDGAEDCEIDILGKPTLAIKYKGSYYPPDRLPYFHADWNLLMSVVGKCYKAWISAPVCPHQCCRFMRLKVHDLKINTLWAELINFITWYNGLPKKKQELKLSDTTKA